MKLHLLLSALIICSSCGFFDQTNPTKKKAKRLLVEIQTMQTELEPKIEELIEIGNTPPKSDMTEEEIELHAIGYSMNNLYSRWKKGLASYQKQDIYMNNDLQVIRLERLKENLENIAHLVEKGESFMKE